MPDTIAPADTPFTHAEGRQVIIVHPADFPVQLSAIPAGTESIGTVGLLKNQLQRRCIWNAHSNPRQRAHRWYCLRQRIVCSLKG